MMKLALMKRFFDSVDTQWRSTITDALASRWLETPKEVDFNNAVAEKGIPAAQPVLSKDGYWIESLDTPLGLFHAVLFTFLFHGLFLIG